MSTQMGEAAAGRTRRLSPDDVRRRTFNRVPLGRRGFDEEEVQQFLMAIAEVMVGLETEIDHVLDENRRLKHAMREWHRQQVGYDSAELMARTQQEIDTQIARAESYSREREEDAARRYDAIIAEAYQRAEELLEARLPAGELAAGEASSVEPGAEPSGPDEALLQAQAAQAQAQGLLRALDGLASHIDAARLAFAQQVDSGEVPSDDGPVDSGPVGPVGPAGSVGLVGPAEPVGPDARPGEAGGVVPSDGGDDGPNATGTVA